MFTRAISSRSGRVNDYAFTSPGANRVTRPNSSAPAATYVQRSTGDNDDGGNCGRNTPCVRAALSNDAVCLAAKPRRTDQQRNGFSVNVNPSSLCARLQLHDCVASTKDSAPVQQLLRRCTALKYACRWRRQITISQS